MKLLLTVAVLILLAPINTLGGVRRGDVKAQEIESLVSQLSWESTFVTCNMLALQIYPKGDAALRLIQIGKPATDELLDALTVESKALAAHVILTSIWEPRLANFVIGAAIYRRRLLWKKFAGVVENFGGLTWSTYKGKRRIDKRELIENASSWRRKVKMHEVAVVS